MKYKYSPHHQGKSNISRKKKLHPFTQYLTWSIGSRWHGSGTGKSQIVIVIDSSQRAARRRRVNGAIADYYRRRRVRDVDMRATINVACAALPARAPRAVEQSGQVLAPGGGAHNRLRREIGRERADCRVNVKRHEEQQRSTAGRGDERQCRGCVEAEALTAGTPLRSTARRAVPEFQQLARTCYLF